MTVACCSCGRTFGSFVALLQHQQAKGHADTTEDFTRSQMLDAVGDALIASAAAPHLPHRLPDDPAVEDWHAVGIAICVVAARVKAGEDIDLLDEAAALGIPERRLVRALRAHGAIIPEFA